MEKRDELIDILRFVLIIFVFQNHLTGVVDFFTINPAVSEYLLTTGFGFTSPGLALISGYLLFLNSNEGDGFIKTSKKILKRACSLAVPYLLWISFFFLVVNLGKDASKILLAKSIASASHQINLHQYLRALLDPDAAKISIGQFWFLQVLIIAVLSSSILRYIYSSYVYFVPVFFLVIFLADGSSSIARFLPYFLVGSFFGFNKIPVFEWFETLSYRIAFPIAMICAALIYFMRVTDLNSGFGLLISNLSYLILIAITIVTLTKNCSSRNFLVSISSFSFYVFVFHCFFFSIFSRAFFYVTMHFNLNNIFSVCVVNIVLSMVLTILTIMGVMTLLRRRFNGFYKISIGRIW